MRVVRVPMLFNVARSPMDNQIKAALILGGAIIIAVPCGFTLARTEHAFAQATTRCSVASQTDEGAGQIGCKSNSYMVSKGAADEGQGQRPHRNRLAQEQSCVARGADVSVDACLAIWVQKNTYGGGTTLRHYR